MTASDRFIDTTVTYLEMREQPVRPTTPSPRQLAASMSSSTRQGTAGWR